MTDPRFSIIPADAVLDKRLEPRDLQVLCVFGKHTDKRGWCRRSQVVMAKEIGCARSTVQASIDRLVSAGWLHKRLQNDLHTKGIRDSAHEYRVVLDMPDQPQDVVDTLPTDRHPLPTISEIALENPKVSGHRHPPAGGAAPENAGVSGGQKPKSSAPMLTTPLTIPSLTASESVSFDQLWEVFPRRKLTNRKDAITAFGELDEGEKARCLIAAKRFAQWHIEDCEIRNATPDSQVEYRIGLGKWIRSGAWIEALTVVLKSDPVPPSAEGVVTLPPNHPDVRAVERLRGKPVILGKSGNATLRIEEIEQARKAAA